MTIQNYGIVGSGGKQIAASVEAAIASGALGPGARLPPVRTLAAELGVSTATAATAYRMLRDRGLLEGEGRGGTKVRAGRPRSLRRSAPAIADGVRNLAGGNPDPALLPDLGPALASAAARLEGGRSRLYGHGEGNPELVAHFARAFAEDGIATDRVLIVGGGLDGVARVLGAHLRPGDPVAVEDPCHCGLLDVLDVCDLRVVPVPVDDEGVLPDRLDIVADRVRAVVLTPRLHSPTGATASPERRDALAQVLTARPGLLVVEDDHSALVADASLHALAQGADRPHWAVVRSTSKALGPDLRLGALATDTLTARRVVHAQQAASGWVSHLLQSVVLALFDDPDLTRLLGRARDTYATRRRALVDALAAHGVVATGASGLNAWVPVDDEATVAQSLLARGWAVRGGSAFRIESPPGLRVTTATLLAKEATRLAGDIAEALVEGRPDHAA
ncbi:MAG: aminotransferase class I/II-fold pyridoxal phosphate-dependent enzyme [Acidimicrobiales bacterium]